MSPTAATQGRGQRGQQGQIDGAPAPQRARGRRADLGSRLLLAALAFVVVGAELSRPARAQTKTKWVDLHGSVLVGGTTGGGTARGAPDFFDASEGFASGVNLGVRLFVVDFSIRFLQMIDSHGAASTLSTALLGSSLEIPLVGGGQDISGRPRRIEVVLRPGLGAGFALGTPAPVHLPIDNAQLSAKGLLVQGSCGIERLFGPYFGIGATLEGGYHYLFGQSATLNSGSDRSQGWQLAIFTMFTGHFGV
jgi:hypothetical protein